jgi:hypothetical protein
MVSAPILVRIFDLRGWTLARSAVATIGYFWMAWIFLATVAFLVSDCLFVASAGIDFFLKTDLRLYCPSPGILFGVVAGGCLLLVARGEVEARSLRLASVVETGSAAMPADRFRIAHVSDVHIGPVSPVPRLRIVGVDDPSTSTGRKGAGRSSFLAGRERGALRCGCWRCRKS